MKRLNILIIIILLGFSALAQNISCGTVENPNKNSTNGINCYDWMNYAPLVTNETPIKYVNLNIHVIQKDDGSCNFPDNQQARDWINNDILNGFNNRWANFQQMIEQPSNTPLIVDSRIRFIIKNIYYHQSDYYNLYVQSSSRGYAMYQNYVVNNPAITNKTDAINIFLTDNPNSQNPGLGFTNIDTYKYLVLADYYDAYLSNEAWKTVPIFTHEVGHSFGLSHSWYTDDYCDDTPIGASGWQTTNNLMNYNACACSITECQIGRIHWHLMGNGIVSSTVIKDYCEIVDAPMEITTNTIWDNPVNIKGNIEIKNGATLTIKCEVSMPKNAKIIVEPGGLLKVYGGTITNNCDKMWRGIEIQGDASTSQYAANNHKGRVILSNATIENAYKAVTCYNGGILEANSSNFFNNSISLTFYAWTNPGYYANRNKSGIQNCNFEINKEVLNNGNTFALSCIYVSNNGGKLEFKGNTFTNTNQNWTTSDLGFGITAYSSNIDVNYRCKVITQIGEECPENQRDSSEFNNLDLGIYSAAYNTSSTEINQCIFNNNHRSVNISGNLNVATITRNTFNAGNHTSDYKPYSLYLNSNTGYTIEENEFNGNIAADAGVYVYNSGSDNNQIYKNIFSGYTRSNGASAVIANRKNSNYISGDNYYDGFAGLEFRCNEFNNYNGNQVKHNYAMAVVSGNIRKDQGNSGGTTTELAGNTFDQSGNNPEADLHFDARISSYYNIPHYNYYQHSTSNAQIEDYDNNKVTTYTYTGIGFDEDLACPSHISTGGGGTGGFDMMATKTEVEKLDAEIITEQDQLKTLVDNGNTDILLSQTETATDNNFTDVSIKVKQSEGFISDAVAKEYINSPVEQDFVKANTLIEISPLPENAKKELEKTNMNPTLKYIVSQYQNGKNIREQKELSISNKKFDRQMLIRNAIRKAVNDTLQETTDSLIQFLENRDELENKYTLVGLLTKNKNFANARNQLSKLNAIKTDYSIEKQEEITTFINLQNIVLNIAENNYSITESIVENNIAFLNTLAADSNSIFMASAWSLLEQTEKGSFTEQVVLPKANINNKSFKLEQVKPFSKHNGLEPLINIYPNPADDHITVEYAMLNKGDAVTVSIYDMQGKLIKQVKSANQIDVLTINISELTRGMYNVRFVSALQGNYTVKITKK